MNFVFLTVVIQWLQLLTLNPLAPSGAFLSQRLVSVAASRSELQITFTPCPGFGTLRRQFPPVGIPAAVAITVQVALRAQERACDAQALDAAAE